MRTFYPKIDPFKVEHISVSDVHSLYLEQSGNPDGVPVLYIHGGPGGGSNPNFRRYFNPKAYRIIQFDQRGCGRSTPHACLDDNTTQALVSDIETIRVHLGIETWLIAGGSWGTTLSIAYTQAFPDRVTEVILRGLFLCRDKEIEWMYQKGASFIYPDHWENYLKPIAPDKRHDLLGAYYEALTSDDGAWRLEAARAWSVWEVGMMNVRSNAVEMDAVTDEDALAMSRVECHFFINKIFMDHDNQLIDGIKNISHIPATLVQGRHDMVCPTETAWDVHKAWAGSNLHIIPEAAHAYNEPGIVNQIILAADAYIENRP